MYSELSCAQVVCIVSLSQFLSSLRRCQHIDISLSANVCVKQYSYQQANSRVYVLQITCNMQLISDFFSPTKAHIFIEYELCARWTEPFTAIPNDVLGSTMICMAPRTQHSPANPHHPFSFMTVNVYVCAHFSFFICRFFHAVKSN